MISSDPARAASSAPKPPTTPTLGWALRYVALGWRVLPVWRPISVGVCGCPKGASCGRDAGKHPISRLVPHGKSDASNDEQTVRAWFTQCPQANIAVALPEPRFFVVDVDTRHDGLGKWEAIRSAHEPLPPTVYAVTGSGGAHGVFGRPSGLELRGKIMPGIDLPASYILVAPSLHACGRYYEWIRSPFEYPIADPPEWLTRLVSRGGGQSVADVPFPGLTRVVPGEGHASERQLDTSDSGRAWNEGLRLLRENAPPSAIESILRESASYRKRRERSEHDADRWLALTLRKLIASNVSRAATTLRVKVHRAVLQILSSAPWKAQAALTRVCLECVTDDGTPLPRQHVVVPDAAHPDARPVYEAVLGDIDPAMWLAPDGWRLAGRLVGRELEIVMAPGARRASRMRRAMSA